MGVVSGDIGLEQLKYRSLGERAAGVLRERIIRGELPPGSRLTEEGYASALGISRSCVKEAFMLLESEGLVARRVRNKFNEVITFTDQDVDEISSLRYALEFMAAETCIRKGAVPVEALRDQIEVIVEIADADQQDVDAYVQADFVFHELILDASANQRAILVWHKLKSQVRALLYSVVSKNPDIIRARGRGHHRELLEALESGDMTRVSNVLHDHIGNLPTLLEYLRSNSHTHETQAARRRA